MIVEINYLIYLIEEIGSAQMLSEKRLREVDHIHNHRMVSFRIRCRGHYGAGVAS